MGRQLVLIHGRSQQNKDAVALKAEWLDALDEGFEKSGLSLPIAEPDVRFPYYGDTLIQMTEGQSADTAADVIVRGEGASDDEARFTKAVLEEMRKEAGITDEQLADVVGQEVVDRGPQNWGWVQGILKAVDRFVPHGSGAGIALATKDVYQYLKNPAVQQEIDEGVAQAFTPGVETSSSVTRSGRSWPTTCCGARGTGEAGRCRCSSRSARRSASPRFAGR